MRFLADENFPGDAVSALRELGHDIRWVREERPSIEDNLVLEWALQEGRILLTFDKDFGELAFRRGSSIDSGIILFRFGPFSSSEAASLCAAAIESREDWAGAFSVVDRNRIRMRRAPLR